MNATRFEKRMESVRSLPRGHFDKYRQMFDLKRKSKKHRQQQQQQQPRSPYTPSLAANTVISEADEEAYLETRLTSELANHSLAELPGPMDDETEKLHLEMNKIFDDVSNDTNSLITSLCSANLNLNELLANLTSNTDTETGSLTGVTSSDKSSSLKSVSSSTTGSVNTNQRSLSSSEWYQAVPVYNDAYEAAAVSRVGSTEEDVEFR